MFKKSLAAALLMVMVAWAEMALAPMLFMHRGHVHAAREMAEPVSGQTVAHHHHAMPAGHPCCPGIGKTENTAPSEFAAINLPCQNEHRCCFQQGPQNVPAPVNARVSREIAPAVIAGISPDRAAESHVSPTSALALGPPPGQFGMVLRV
jgi:hypothetical protein